jgi:hypothetical protein
MGKAFERAPPSVKRFGVLIPMLATAAANCSNIGFYDSYSSSLNI